MYLITRSQTKHYIKLAERVRVRTSYRVMFAQLGRSTDDGSSGLSPRPARITRHSNTLFDKVIKSLYASALRHPKAKNLFQRHKKGVFFFSFHEQQKLWCTWKNRRRAARDKEVTLFEQVEAPSPGQMIISTSQLFCWLEPGEGGVSRRKKGICQRRRRVTRVHVEELGSNGSPDCRNSTYWPLLCTFKPSFPLFSVTFLLHCQKKKGKRESRESLSPDFYLKSL
jgi:hypothetical protein